MSSLESVLVVGDQIGTCFAGTSGCFCWPNLGCDEVNRLFVSGIYHNYTGRGWITLFALDKYRAMFIVKAPKYRHNFHHCSVYQLAVGGRSQCYGWGLGIDNNTSKAILNLQSFTGIDTVVLQAGINIFSAIYCDYVIRLYEIKNRYFLQVWLWPCCYHISSINRTNF